MQVSIHAPTWGATNRQRTKSPNEKFQSTHPHGVRLALTVIVLSFFPGFNPRTHMGCDGATLRGPQSWEFQSTHPHGVRRSRVRLNVIRISFNPRTHMGCDLSVARSIDRIEVSIHAPTWGATSRNIGAVSIVEFQSTHPHGVRLRYPPF